MRRRSRDPQQPAGLGHADLVALAEDVQQAQGVVDGAEGGRHGARCFVIRSGVPQDRTLPQPGASMAARTSPPFRADHVGSLLRPPALLRPATTTRRGASTTPSSRPARTRPFATRWRCSATWGSGRDRRGVPPRVVAHGLHLRAGRRDEGRGREPHVQFHNEEGDIEFTPAAARVTGRSACRRRSSRTRFTFLRDTVADGVTPKLTIPSPSMVHYRGGRSAIDESVYPDLDRVLGGPRRGVRRGGRRLHGLGCRYLQLDDTSLAYVNDPEQRKYIAPSAATPSTSTRRTSPTSTGRWPAARPT